MVATEPAARLTTRARPSGWRARGTRVPGPIAAPPRNDSGWRRGWQEPREAPVQRPLRHGARHRSCRRVHGALRAARPPLGKRELPARYSDNYLWLVPGEERDIRVSCPLGSHVRGDLEVTAQGYRTSPAAGHRLCADRSGIGSGEGGGRLPELPGDRQVQARPAGLADQRVAREAEQPVRSDAGVAGDVLRGRVHEWQRSALGVLHQERDDGHASSWCVDAGSSRRPALWPSSAWLVGGRGRNGCAGGFLRRGVSAGDLVVRVTGVLANDEDEKTPWWKVLTLPGDCSRPAIEGDVRGCSQPAQREVNSSR